MGEGRWCWKLVARTVVQGKRGTSRCRKAHGSGAGAWDEMALATTWEIWRKVVKSCSRLGSVGSWVMGATDASAADANRGG